MCSFSVANKRVRRTTIKIFCTDLSTKLIGWRISGGVDYETTHRDVLLNSSFFAFILPR